MTNEKILIGGIVVLIIGFLFLSILYSTISNSNKLGTLLKKIISFNIEYIISLFLIIVGIILISISLTQKEDYGYSYTEEDERKRLKNDVYQLDKF